MHMRALLPLSVAVLVVLSLMACRYDEPARVAVPADSAAGAISFELAGAGEAALVVPVYLNGEGPHQFVLDTGATLTCVNEALADSLDLPGRQSRFGIGAGVGSAGNVQLVGVDSLRVGKTEAFDMTACALDLSQLEQAGLEVDGLLGLNFLKSFRVTLDFSRNILHLQQP